MQRYKTFRPTGFDSPGLAGERLDISEWLVLPCSGWTLRKPLAPS